jgi:hypothetical protein
MIAGYRFVDLTQHYVYRYFAAWPATMLRGRGYAGRRVDHIHGHTTDLAGVS